MKIPGDIELKISSYQLLGKMALRANLDRKFSPVNRGFQRLYKSTS